MQSRIYLGRLSLYVFINLISLFIEMQSRICLGRLSLYEFINLISLFRFNFINTNCFQTKELDETEPTERL